MTVLCPGSVGSNQDLATVLGAVAHLSGSVDVRVLIAGENSDISRFRALASQLNVTDVEFRRPVAADRLWEFLMEGDVHVICQEHGTEGLLVPGKTYGTMAAGRPSLFVGPANCEVATILEDSRSGCIVASGDVDGAVAAIRTLARSPALREEMGLNARDYYEYYFSPDRDVSRVVKTLKKSYAGSQTGYNRHAGGG